MLKKIISIYPDEVISLTDMVNVGTLMQYVRYMQQK